MKSSISTSRDGEVYYRALKIERAKLDGYVGSLATAAENRMGREERIAFWMNAYNALVLQTVIDHYPIAKRSNDYPAKSIRQIPARSSGCRIAWPDGT